LLVSWTSAFTAPLVTAVTVPENVLRALVFTDLIFPFYCSFPPLSPSSLFQHLHIAGDGISRNSISWSK
jgi:hypothetical protein